jgi:hypothetical protein
MKLLKNLLCKITPYPFSMLVHKFEVVEEYDEWNRKLKCSSCEQYFLMCDTVKQVFNWSPELEGLVCHRYELKCSKK